MTKNYYILNIHTTGEMAMVCLSKANEVCGSVFNPEFKEHSKFLHPAINRLLEENHLSAPDLKAVAVTHGPGSYTGIRVGLAAAKGLSYALNIPLITLNTLDVLTESAIQEKGDSLSLYCPMIDARRMEVYTTLYNYDQIKLLEAQAVILDNTFCETYTKLKNVYFFGSGSIKFRDLMGENNTHYKFIDIEITPEAMSTLSYKRFLTNTFSDLAYSEPEYLKDFISTTNN